MPDIDTILAAIDALAVQECGGCGKPLPVDGPSPYYCGEYCAARWNRARQGDPLPDDEGLRPRYEPQSRVFDVTGQTFASSPGDHESWSARWTHVIGSVFDANPHHLTVHVERWPSHTVVRARHRPPDGAEYRHDVGTAANRLRGVNAEQVGAAIIRELRSADPGAAQLARAVSTAIDHLIEQQNHAALVQLRSEYDALRAEFGGGA